MKYADRVIFLFYFVISCFACSPGICQESGGVAPSTKRPHKIVEEKESEKNVGVRLASFFRDCISKVDGDRCSSLPSCSSYSVNAFKKHGIVVGWLMTVDRLIHEGDEGSVSPQVYYKGRLWNLDPVENNDFWWSCEDESTQK